ncbi:hypothetical protein [Niabella soli]|uniref:Uncharacterized protein n=1 Tax=Niabella soli DSM 19437 TaxID=929713 RepID=W0F768_9BACT|nr:hypothetical protein [Niabella soli]AHF17186.1 hypothetical protein NIASO_03290 [Niabella soli DSM 19437]
MKDKKETETEPIKPDAETLHTTDPQEKMKGPVSTPTRNLEKLFDVSESEEQAKKKKDAEK